MKKFLKLCFKIALVLVILGVAALVALRLMFPPEKLKSMALEYAKNNLQREISFDGISLNLVGVTLDNFAISENTTFQNGTFAKADKLVVKIALKPLFKKRVEIATVQLDGLDVNVIKKQDGSFNFDTLIPASDPAAAASAEQPAQPAAASSSAFVLLADKISANDCSFSYHDLQTGMKASVDKLNLEINQLDLAEPFDVKINFNTFYQQKNGPAVAVPVNIALRVFLSNLDMKNAYVTVNDISASYKTVKFQLKGGVRDFTAPQADLTGTLSGISNAIFADFLPNLPDFSLPVINMNLKAAADLEKSSATISQAKLSVMDSALSAYGTVGWNGPAPTYSVNADLTTNLAQIVQMTSTVAGFNPGGVISGSFKATDKNEGKDISGSVTFKDISAMYEPFTVSQLNGTVNIASLDNISSNSLTGLLNGEKFTSSFSYQNIKDVMNVVLNLDLAKFTLKELPAAAAETTAEAAPQTAAEDSASQEAQPAAQTTAASSGNLLLNLKANIKVGPIEVPYFRADGFSLTANLTDITDTMTKANGQVSFNLQPGAITNLDSFVKENKIVKILLLPISIVRKVAGALNVELFPAQENAQKGEISFTSGEGVYTFVNGVMRVDKTTFNSQVTDISGSGTINFLTQALDMKVSATVLTSQTPVVIKIGGTMDNPSGKLDVVSTVGSLVGGILNYKTSGKVVSGTANAAGNVASGAVKTTGKVAATAANAAADTVKGTVNAAKDALKGLGGLFKKSDSSEEKK
ncbi:AsmA family protein [Candidatus Avelusimicrobium gallicola]|uniref:AsmA domain-containing protein n=1 Tax=Candidatus Avelusimicrobium gallicola TaxID=2562704 RepID=A0A1Y4DCL3_9BACT|nr:AsmA family protein [Elusimicrobium sp. An273]OUO56786.1 hypothetical protein B5F75_02780 [Elusimicrobium sp. An273]